ncbi:ubiquitin-2 like Rad60 SUMO-like-domain-containing protein [Microdochium trichocladiopsis]|uniref:Ubiquitin-2 like Rad60 SUMO-like-domain-containing protein n=1 Tax=Microdochium trichocladiopsis TaxID=1682393 RepID=A0A9P8YAJ9_9PEZI|nr:ubiquitin-2 like Rad60 SUMO-like-domain-containing protein [Microdochium trichocladiopsis]KAH7034851.1 ubiquitin-2 like Rad60 SUMO-like-domain-containing protein [Microdochium trichocladiopsis]
MADTNAAAAPQPRKLPFKRTVKRKPVEEVPSAQPEPKEDDGLELFKRSREFFPSVIEDQKKEAAEKAARAERERQEAAGADERRKREDVGGRRAPRTTQHAENDENSGSSPKRRRTGFWDSHDDTPSPPDDMRTSRASHRSPTSNSPLATSPARNASNGRAGRTAVKQQATVISLDDSDDEDDRDEDYQPPRSKTKREPAEATPRAVRAESSEVELIMEGSASPPREKDSDEFEIYVQRAMERAQKEKEAQLAGSTSTPDSSAKRARMPVVEVLIASRDDTLIPTSFKVRTDQRLGLMFEAWIARQIGKRPGHPDPVLANMVFTWKRNRLWTNTTLSTLGINPDPHGHLYNKWDSAAEGFDRDNGQDKVFFEAWTREQFEEYEQAKEYQRLRALGEIDDDDFASSFPSTAAGGGASQSQNPGLRAESLARHEEAEAAEEKKIRITLKPKQLAPKTLTVKPSTNVAMLIKVFCRMSELPTDTRIEIHWDGEVLDPETTVEEAEIEDMDSVEVHLK